MLQKIRMHNLNIGLLYLGYRILLDFIYIHWINPIYGYSGFVYEANAVNMYISYLIVLFFIVIIPKENNRISYRILQLHLIVMLIPLTSIYSMANLSTSFMVMITICFALQICLVKLLPLVKIIKIRNAKEIIVTILGALTLITYICSLSRYSINMDAFDITKIYDIREEQDGSGIIGYLVTWQYRIINPFILVISLLKKKYNFSFVAIGLQILLYLIYPHKEIFLSIGLILLVLYITKKNYRFDSLFIYFLSICSLAAVAIYEFLNNVILFSVLPVRLLFIPAIIKFQHYEFFLTTKKLYYSEGLIGKLLGIKYPYSVPSGMVVGGGGNNANTGYLAYAYDNLGFLGMIIMSLLFVFLLVLIDSLVRDENKNLIFALLIFPMIVLNDGDLLTLLFTGGLFVLILILFAFNTNSVAKNLEGR